MQGKQPIFEQLELRVLLSAAAPAEAPQPTDLISVGESWQYFKGVTAPPVDWADAGFDDSSWMSGPSGIGYSSDITFTTDLPDMYDGYVTFYSRRSFDAADAETFSALELGIQYDDGFVAYLNGVEIARSASMGSAGSPTTYDQEASSSHDEEAPEEIYSVTLNPGQLMSAGNVLAIEVHNIWIRSSDAGMIPRLAGITNRPPQADASLSYSSTDTAPAIVSFDGGASLDIDGAIVSYWWDFGDGSPVQSGPEASVQHEYLTAGIRQAVLTVTDDDGDTDSVSLTVRIGPGDTYYAADPRGADGIAGTPDDVDANDAYPGTIDQPFATLQKASEVAVLGDTVFIRGGTYNERLIPQNSGGPQRYVTFRNYADETPTITGASLSPGVNISYRSYIAVQGLTITDVDRWLWAIDSHHNIIEGNRFANAFNPGGSSKGGLFFQEATYNKILNNVITNNTSDNLALHLSDHNLIEGNTITNAGHTLWTIKAGNFNVLRDNYFHNPLQKIGEVYDAWGAGFDHEFYVLNSTKHNLITDNVFDYTPSSGNHSPYSGIQYAGQDGIIRQNMFYDTVGPALSLTLYAEEAKYTTGNRVYQNVFSRTDFAGVTLPGSGYAFEDNVIKNNVMSNSFFEANDTRWSWYTQELAGQPVQLFTGRLDGFVFENNDLWAGQGDQPYLITYGSRTSSSNPPQQTVEWWETNHPELFAANLTADPKFADESGRDFNLQSDSPLIDAGAFLTQTLAAGDGTAIPVADASYFYDGYGIPGETGDEIQFDGQTQTAIVVGIDYDQNILHVDRPMTWTDGAGLALRYAGGAPDMGAIEYEVVGESPSACLFYNHSLLDGDDAGANPNDDNAIAADKSPLLPGQTATAANYTNYCLGINGVMVDLANPAGAPEPADFGFKLGVDSNPSSWSNAPEPEITVRPGEGVGGADRVSLVWADCAIADQWLEVTVRAGGATGLTEDYVFYFGNITADTDGDGQIAYSDYNTLVGQFGSSGSGLSTDFNCDGRSDLEDFAVLRAAYGNSQSLPTMPQSPAPAPLHASGSPAATDGEATAYSPQTSIAEGAPGGGSSDGLAIVSAAFQPTANSYTGPQSIPMVQSPLIPTSSAAVAEPTAVRDDNSLALNGNPLSDEKALGAEALDIADSPLPDILAESSVILPI